MDNKRLKRALGGAIPLAYVIGYITSGVGETIKLERGKWYRVEGIGELTVRPVNVRIE